MRLFLECVLPYVAVTVFLAGMAGRAFGWLRTPVPFPQTLVPASRGPLGRVLAAVGELALFRALYRGDRLLWCWAWLMHVSLALVILGHVAGIGWTGQQFVPVRASPETSAWLSQVLGTAAGVLLAICLSALGCRRALIPELRCLSDPFDYVDLALLLAVVASGLLMRGMAADVDLAEVRAYLHGLATFQPVARPLPSLLLAHVTLVNGLLLYAPFSKFVHWMGALVARSLLVQPPPAYPTPAGVGQEACCFSRARNDAP
jgi:nitrate reductase gamma subunit